MRRARSVRPRVRRTAHLRAFDLDKGRFDVTEAELRKRLEQLRIEHRDLDAAIAALSALESPDQLQIARLKKRKLQLRDRMTAIEDELIPDIIA
ncbi:hypothetical protein TMRO357_01143 [Alteriqipengyuania sp. 357]